MDVTGVRPGIDVVGALARACRRAAREKRPVVDTAMVLRCGMAGVRQPHPFPMPYAARWRVAAEFADGAPRAERSRLIREFDRQVEILADGALREAAYDARPKAVPFTPLVRHAVYEAVHEAGRRDGVAAGCRHLMAALLAEPAGAARAVTARIAGAEGFGFDRRSPQYRAGGVPSSWALAWHRRRWMFPLLVRSDAIRQAVRLARASVGTAEVLLSLLELHEQLETAGIAEDPRDGAGRVLRAHGVRLIDALVVAADTLDAAADDPPLRRPPLEPQTRSALRAAGVLGRDAGTGRVLAEILRAPDGSAARLVRTLGAGA